MFGTRLTNCIARARKIEANRQMKQMKVLDELNELDELDELDEMKLIDEMKVLDKKLAKMRYNFQRKFLGIDNYK